jgi:exodeoxyribonuclease VII large subunit
MSGRLGQLLAHETDRIAQLRGRPAIAMPERIVDERAEELVRWIARGTELADRAIEDRTRSLAETRARLAALSPRATLERGYAIAQLADGAVLRDPAHAPKGTAIGVSLAGGRIAATSNGAA